MLRRLQDVLIVLLAVAAVALSALAVVNVNRSRPPEAATLDPTAFTAAGPPVDDASATSTSAPDDAASTTSGGAEPDVDGWVQAWSGDADLLVVGDGFSHLPGQWLQLWADRVGRDRPVTIHHWGEAADVAFNDPIELSTGDGAPLSLWSASRDGTTIHDAAQDYPRFVEASARPDAVLVSMGLDSGEEDVAAGLDELLAQVDDLDPDVPVLLAIGPDGLYDEGVGDALRAWADEHADRVAVLDLRGEAPAAASAEQWAAAFQSALDQP